MADAQRGQFVIESKTNYREVSGLIKVLGG